MKRNRVVAFGERVTRSRSVKLKDQRRERALSSFNGLANELHYQWMSFLTPRDLNNFSYVSKDTYKRLMEPELWDILFKQCSNTNTWVEGFKSSQKQPRSSSQRFKNQVKSRKKQTLGVAANRIFLTAVPQLTARSRVFVCHWLNQYQSSLGLVAWVLLVKARWDASTVCRFLFFLSETEDETKKLQSVAAALAFASVPRDSIARALCKLRRTRKDRSSFSADIACALYAAQGANMSIDEVAGALHSKNGGNLPADKTACALLQASFPMEVVAWALHEETGAGLSGEAAGKALFEALASLDAVAYSLYMQGGIGMHPTQVAGILLKLTNSSVEIVAEALLTGARMGYKQIACSMYFVKDQHGLSSSDICRALVSGCCVSATDATCFVEGLEKSEKSLSPEEFSFSIHQYLSGSGFLTTLR